METSGVKTLLVAAGVVIMLLALASVVVGSVTDDANAARRPQLKTLWAVVEPDGTLDRGKGVTESDKVSTGQYEIRFNREVSGCAHSATFDHTSGFIFISLRDSDIGPREVGVTTTDRNAVVRDSTFHLIVTC